MVALLVELFIEGVDRYCVPSARMEVWDREGVVGAVA